VGARSDDPRVQRVVQFYEQLREDDLPRLGEIYAADARFKDPFNQVQGLQPIRAIFAHMFKALREPRFCVQVAVVQHDDAFLTWDFRLHPRRHAPALRCRRPGGRAPRLLGRGRGAVREAAAAGRADALAQAACGGVRCGAG
jgi:hypothetical protein